MIYLYVLYFSLAFLILRLSKIFIILLEQLCHILPLFPTLLQYILTYHSLVLVFIYFILFLVVFKILTYLLLFLFILFHYLLELLLPNQNHHFILTLLHMLLRNIPHNILLHHQLYFIFCYNFLFHFRSNQLIFLNIIEFNLFLLKLIFYQIF